MLNILVTGANGQLGNEMRLLGATSKNNYIFTDVTELNITDKAAISAMVKEHRIQVIINCAAYTNVDKAEDDEATADLLNHTAARVRQDQIGWRTGYPTIGMSLSDIPYGVALLFVRKQFRKNDAPSHERTRYAECRIRPGRFSDFCR